MRKFFRDLSDFCVPFWPLVAIVAVLILLWTFLLPAPAKSQTVCTYAEQTGTVKNCVGMAQLNQVATVTNGSGAITQANTSQQVFAATPGRMFLFVQNPASATEPLYVEFGSAATATSSIALAPGGIAQFMAGVTPTQSVNVMAATAGHTFIAKQG